MVKSDYQQITLHMERGKRWIIIIPMEKNMSLIAQTVTGLQKVEPVVSVM